MSKTEETDIDIKPTHSNNNIIYGLYNNYNLCKPILCWASQYSTCIKPMVTKHTVFTSSWIHVYSLGMFIKTV